MPTLSRQRTFTTEEDAHALNSKDHLVELQKMLENFEDLLERGSIRDRVRSLVKIHRKLLALGRDSLPATYGRSARSRILAYLRVHSGQIIEGKELMVVGGISEYARRVRELRVEHGWPIISGVSAAGDELEKDDEQSIDDGLPRMRPAQYSLVEDQQDTKAANRWRSANEIRGRPIGSREKLLAYFRENVGEHLTVEELRYVSGGAAEWARRIRELRTEGGWPIVTRFSGDPRLPSGVYVLKDDRQDEPHDRHISELTRREVLKRDGGRCRWEGCGWPVGFPESDSRFLELHHVVKHADKGTNDQDNLVTLCNLHHDEVHRRSDLKITLEPNL